MAGCTMLDPRGNATISGETITVRNDLDEYVEIEPPVSFPDRIPAPGECESGKVLRGRQLNRALLERQVLPLRTPIPAGVLE